VIIALKQMSERVRKTQNAKSQIRGKSQASNLKRRRSDQRRFESWRLEFARVLVLGASCSFLIGCATVSRHEFTQPASGWQTRTGQLLYRNATTTLIGETIVRYSSAGDFELTFSKGPGVTLLILRQDKSFAEMGGALARNRWSGSIAHAPAQLRGWLALRDKIIQARNQRSIRVIANGETFEFRF
jgi:hypothetical protein